MLNGYIGDEGEFEVLRSDIVDEDGANIKQSLYPNITEEDYEELCMQDKIEKLEIPNSVCFEIQEPFCTSIGVNGNSCFVAFCTNVAIDENE